MREALRNLGPRAESADTEGLEAFFFSAERLEILGHTGRKGGYRGSRSKIPFKNVDPRWGFGPWDVDPRGQLELGDIDLCQRLLRRSVLRCESSL